MVCSYWVCYSPAEHSSRFIIVCLQLKYEHILYWGTAEGHFSQLNRVQLEAWKLFEDLSLPSLESHRVAAVVGLTRRLLSGSVKFPLLSLTSVFFPLASPPFFCIAFSPNSSHQFSDQCTYHSLEVFKRSYRGRI